MFSACIPEMDQYVLLFDLFGQKQAHEGSRATNALADSEKGNIKIYQLSFQE